MSVKTPHKDYLAMVARWQRCRDAAEGQDAIHTGGAMYLPKLSEQTEPEYAAYLTRACFFNATRRTLSGLRGMIFRKPPVVVAPAAVEPLLEDVTGGGESLFLFCMKHVLEVLTVGRVGMFVDYPVVDMAIATAADAQKMNLRPTLKKYDAECLINWKTSVVRNTIVPTMVVLEEEVEVKVSEFVTVCKTQYRVLDLATIPNELGGTNTVYRVRVFEVDEKGNDVQMSEVFPVVKGKLLDYIPFYCLGVNGIGFDVDVPPLIDLVDVNLSHFRTTADYEHGCHFTGLPTPVISGYTPAVGEKLGVGSTTAWVFPRSDAKAAYLEFTGTGLASLEKNLDRKEKQMAVLGARMLDGDLTSVGDSGPTTAINLGGEQSLLASIAQALSVGIEIGLNTMAEFMGATRSVKFSLNKDFFPMPMTPLALTALVAGWQNGAYNYQTLFDALKRGEVIDIDRTIEEELAGMKLHEPVIPGGTQVNQTGKAKHEVTMPTNRQLQTP